MPIDARVHDASRVQTSADAERCPLGHANGARSRARRPRRRSAHAPAGVAHAIVALLLLLLLPLGLVHRSSTGACRDGHQVAVAAGAGHDVGIDAPAAASAAHERIVAGDRHDHHGSALPLEGAAPSACGPAIPVERAAPVSVAPFRSVLPVWRALSPLALAPPPPAPPPRLS